MNILLQSVFGFKQWKYPVKLYKNHTNENWKKVLNPDQINNVPDRATEIFHFQHFDFNDFLDFTKVTLGQSRPFKLISDQWSWCHGINEKSSIDGQWTRNFSCVVKNVEHVDDFSSKNEIIEIILNDYYFRSHFRSTSDEIPVECLTFEMEQFDSFELWWCHNTTSSWKFGHQLNDTEEIDISIVDSEINHYNTSSAINPQPFLELTENWFGFVTLATE